MGTGIHAAVGEVQRLRDIAWDAIETATVDGAERDRWWKAWTDHNETFYGSDGSAHHTVDTNKLLTFAVTVREGKYGLGNQVTVQSVERALMHVAQKFVLSSPAQQSLDLPLSRLIKHYRNNDPAPQPKLALPISTITAIATNYRWTPHLDTVADLVTVAFFYLLRVGEYTSPPAARRKRTISLRKCDVRLWHRGTILQHSAPLATLLSADSATICIANTKNGTKGAVIHHDAVGGAICPVAALARRIAALHNHPPSSCLDTVVHSPRHTTHVSDRDIGIAVRWGAISDGLLLRGYTIDRISSHSLRAGGAMALKLSGASDSTIMRVGRWTSLTYLTYIHTQIGALTAGVAKMMSSAFTFQNVG